MFFTIYNLGQRGNAHYCLEGVKSTLDNIYFNPIKDISIEITDTRRPKYLGPALAKIFNVSFDESYTRRFYNLNSLPPLAIVAMLRLYRSYVKYGLRQDVVEGGLDSVIKNLIATKFLTVIKSNLNSTFYIYPNQHDLLMLLYLYKFNDLNGCFDGKLYSNGIFSGVRSLISTENRRLFLIEAIKKYFGNEIECKKLVSYNPVTYVTQMVPVDSIAFLI